MSTLNSVQFSHGRVLGATSSNAAVQKGIDTHNAFTKIFVNLFGSGTIKVQVGNKSRNLNKNSCFNLVSPGGTDADRKNFLNQSKDKIIADVQAVIDRALPRNSNRRSFPDMEVAVFRLRKETADQGDAFAQFDVSRRYFEGNGVEVSRAKGFEYAKRAADQGHQESIVLMVRAIHADDPDVQNSDAEAFKYWKRLADLGGRGEAIEYKQAQAEVSRCYFEGIGVEISPNKGFEYAKLAAARGKDSCPDFILNKLLARENRFRSTASELFNYWKLVADQGDKEAQLEVGKRYFEGIGVEGSNSEAFKYWKLAADQGAKEAMFRVALQYEEGIGVEQSDSESFKYWKLAADQGDMDAQMKVAERCGDGRGVEQSDIESFKYWKLAADQGDAFAQFEVSKRYFEGNGVEVSRAKGFAYAKRAADQGHQESSVLILRAIQAEDPDVQCSDTETFKYWKRLADLEDSGEAIEYKQAQAEVSRRYFDGIGVESSLDKGFEYAKLAASLGKDSCPDFILNKLLARENSFRSTDSELFNYWKLVADQGDKEAQLEVGKRYFQGIGVEGSNSEAFKYWKLAADQGDKDAMFRVALQYEGGIGVEQSDSESFKYLKLAADQGDMDAQMKVAERCGDGRGVEQSDIESFKYWKLAADQGDMDAQFKVGLKYEEGIGVEQSDSEAFKYWKLAADQGDVWVQMQVADRYGDGRGVEQSDIESFKYWKMAADLGSKEAQRKVADLYATGTGVEQSVEESLRYREMADD